MNELFPVCRHGQAVDDCPYCHARGTDPATSHLAAARIPKGHAHLVLTALESGPATQSEIAQRIDLLPHQVNKRLADLHRLLLIRPTGTSRPGHAGREEREWTTTERTTP